MSNMEVLWVDDDSPEEVEGIEGVKVVTAQTCQEAEQLLTSGKVKPDWAVVDLIIPQGGWGKSVLRIPGLDYIQHLNNTYGDRMGIIAFSILMPEKMKQKAMAAGASDAVAKSSKSWTSVLEEIRKRSSKP